MKCVYEACVREVEDSMYAWRSAAAWVFFITRSLQTLDFSLPHQGFGVDLTRPWANPSKVGLGFIFNLTSWISILSPQKLFYP